MNKALISVATFVVLTTVSFLSLALAQEKDQITVRVTGQASLENVSYDKAINNALKNAFHLAVEQGFGVFVKGEMKIENSHLVKDKIITESEGYILSYKKIRQWDDSGILNLEIEAVLALKQIGDDIRSMVKTVSRQLDHPVIVFVLTAWEVPDPALPKKHVEGQILIDAFQEQFMKRGFDIKAADEAREFANLGTGRLAYVSSAGRKGIVKYARDANANFVARGELIATFNGLNPATAAIEWIGTISTEIIDVSTSELVASYSHTVLKAFPDRAQGLSALMHSAAENAAKALSEQTLVTWQQYVGQGLVYELTVENVTSWRKQAKVLLKVLDKFCEIRNKNYDRNTKKLIVGLRFKGSVTELEDNIFEDDSMAKFKNFDTVQVSGNHLTLTF
ncbi:MAG: hypothetical protein LJE89_12130 [Deltaproteobacteria bacterium]|nr:hypothetical protein [Deltaproteobacteria bacterium]